ncbi:MAG: YbjN domain-containing protein [Planctomycetes bacterium]|nr:YbjN domain-containing protein [Planctomycetota bacterium]
MAGIFSKLIDFMEEEEWKYEILEGESVLRFHFKGRSGRMLCYADVEEEKDWLIFYSYLPVNAPPEKMQTAAEFITRANRGMRIGNFELDFEDGEIRYKTSIDIEGGELTNKMFHNLLQANLSTMDRYFSGIMELIYSEKSPKELIQKIEGAAELLDGLEDEDDEDDDDDEEFPSEFDSELKPDPDPDTDDEEDDGKRRYG